MRTLLSVVFIGSLVASSVYLVLAPELLEEAFMYIASLGPLSYVGFVLLLTAAVVFAPVTVMPITPMASQVFGPFVTGCLSALGWTLGAVIAFYISRYFGRPLLQQFVSLEKIDAFVASVPERRQFWFILIVRHVLPVDVVSYALGLVPSIRFTTYFFASVLGVLWFSFAFAYVGEAFFTGSYFVLFEIVLASLGVLAIAWYVLQYKFTKQPPST